MNFLSCMFPCIGECIGGRDFLFARISIGNRLNFIFFFSPPFLFSLFSSFLAFFVCFFRFSFFFSTLCNKKPFHSSRYVSIAQSFVPLLLLMLLQKKREREGKKDRTLFSPSPLVFILFNRVFGERAILFFARCFSCSGETRRK